jgi:hypothetical protein
MPSRYAAAPHTGRVTPRQPFGIIYHNGCAAAADLGLGSATQRSQGSPKVRGIKRCPPARALP